MNLVIPEGCHTYVHTDEWIPLLAGKGIQSLTLFFDDIGPSCLVIHPQIFSCLELTHLSLGHCRLPSAPLSFTGFPNLISISLTWVAVPEHGEKDLEVIINSVPSLRFLKLVNVWIDSGDFDDWVIQAPNLQRLTVESHSDYGWQLKELSSLERATISVDNYSIGRDFVKLFTCFAQVTHLELHMPIPQIYIQNEGVDTVDLEFFNSLWTNDLFANLDTVTMKDAWCWSNEMHFIEFVLSKAKLLSALYVYQDDDDTNSKPSEEAVIELAKYRRVSPKAKVFFRNMDVSTLTCELPGGSRIRIVGNGGLADASPDAEAAHGGLDYLYPELLSEILYRLPLWDAVRTSALARAWRHRWESAPSLRFIWTGRADPGAISDVLRRYSCPVREFRHYYVTEASFGHSDRWLRLLALRVVQSLFLDFEMSNDDELLHTLHPSIFSCRGLTTLDLGGCYIPAPPPGFTGLPNLTELRLRKVGFTEGARVLELLIATSPLLESLHLVSLSLPLSNGEYNQWVIQSPKLQSLTIDAIFDDEWQINDLPSLEEADIDCVGYSPDRDIVKLMTGLAHATKLKLSMPVNYFLYCPFVSLLSRIIEMSLYIFCPISLAKYPFPVATK
ncbi:hypothetical protein PR202_ga21186 [Eleusine coracana subsp. coracana]|uniref:F-box/LRR-repeat protein 15/At3g58940/PEG3-like LRR domain-containing protein n=1 Tax=Eleusine coracana subsp. coracana TaxID=191504 RepID=A0AAV5D082_ELECO|nr:hypothetical protein PR202_ga21186 [Eleusine coracana subsp. coracana]